MTIAIDKISLAQEWPIESLKQTPLKDSYFAV
jgi:hypothetical protein